MRHHRLLWRGVICGLILTCISLPGQESPPARNPSQNPTPASATKDAESDVARELFSGKVVMLTDALKKRGIKSTAEMKDQVVLETDSGDLWPIVSDWRGRAFFQDERLRNRQVDLVARKHAGVPYLQVLMIFTVNAKGEREYMDYWCDICSIPMYEIKDCDCCQGPIRLRFQKQDLPGYVRVPRTKEGEKSAPSPKVEPKK